MEHYRIDSTQFGNFIEEKKIKKSKSKSTPDIALERASDYESVGYLYGKRRNFDRLNEARTKINFKFIIKIWPSLENGYNLFVFICSSGYAIQSLFEWSRVQFVPRLLFLFACYFSAMAQVVSCQVPTLVERPTNLMPKLSPLKVTTQAQQNRVLTCIVAPEKCRCSRKKKTADTHMRVGSIIQPLSSLIFLYKF